MKFSIEIPRETNLKDVVQRFWQVDRTHEEFNRETIVPKGCVELIFNLYDSAALHATIGTDNYIVPRCFISGNHTVPIHLTIPSRQIFFGVFIQPTALRKLFQISPEEYANTCVDLTLVDKSLDTLWYQLAETTDFHQRISIFNRWLTARLPVTTKHEKLFDHFLSDVSRTTVSAQELSNTLCYSPRHLSRKLYELTGMNLEQTLLYKRYLMAIDLIHNSELLLTEIAHACNFSDQSHLTKTFRAYTNMRPSEYRAAKSRLSGHIFENVR
jgi:AraC-like DNA-binding protein